MVEVALDAWRPTRLHVDLDTVADNVARLTELTATPVCAVVKADGYGLGAVEIARAALRGGAQWLAVALVEEAGALRAAGIDAPLLLLSEPQRAAVDAVVELDVTATVYSVTSSQALADAARRAGRTLDVHLKADTGMSRVGLPAADWQSALGQLTSLEGLRITGLMTHLARADEVDPATTEAQLADFDRFVALARDAVAATSHRAAGNGEGNSAGDGTAGDGLLRHAANTAGALAHPAARYDLVRAGIGIYGLSPSNVLDAQSFGLRSCLRLVAEVSFTKRVARGTAVSYGHRWQAPTDGWLATVPVGYADGVPRAIHDRATVLLNGKRRPIAGTVCMDQLMVWCGDDEPQPGDEVVLLGDAAAVQPGTTAVEPAVEEWADACGTITYEIVTRMSGRLPRVYRSESLGDTLVPSARHLT